MNTQPVKYLQTDSRWAANDYSASGESTTIKASGCGPTCAAMILATLIDAGITPADTCAWALKKGYKAVGQGTYYSYFKPQGAAYGLTWTQLNGSNLCNMTAANAKTYHDQALAAVQGGDLVICCMGPGNWTSGGHFILWWKYADGYVYINDPASTASAREKNTLALLQSQVKYYFVCKTPTTTTEEDDTVTQAQFNEMMAVYEATQAAKTVSTSAAEPWAIAKDCGILDGTKPACPVTREQLTIVLSRVGSIYKNTESAQYAEDYWDAATKAGIVDGKNPQGVVTREMLITILGRLGVLDNV
ncbi:MAG: C39 family peptidase [Oscillospiraceae bacterium]|nr:C39 family peptidase [Oscillospiraceae bacterium]